MLALLIIALDLAAALSPGPLALIPGERLGSVELGMTKAEVTRLGALDRDDQLTLGPLALTIRHGHVTQIAGHFFYADKTQFRIGGSDFELEWRPDGGHTAQELVTRFAGCGRPYRGGEERLWRIWRCRGVRIEERLADGDPEIDIYVQRPWR